MLLRTPWRKADLIASTALGRSIEVALVDAPADERVLAVRHPPSALGAFASCLSMLWATEGFFHVRHREVIASRKCHRSNGVVAGPNNIRETHATGSLGDLSNERRGDVEDAEAKLEQRLDLRRSGKRERND